MRNQGEGFSGIENPFAFIVFQVFAGFGVGCGIGIGIGPFNLGEIPMVGQVMSAARGATDAFSGLIRNMNDTLWNVGAKSIQAGIGYGIGFGHGFGVGLAMKPGAVPNLQSCLTGIASKMMNKRGKAPSSPVDQSSLPVSLQRGLGVINELSTQSQILDLTSQVLSSYGKSGKQLHVDKNSDKNSSPETKFGTRTEKVIDSFLKQQDMNNEMAESLQSEKRILETVLKQQNLIELLMDENEKLQKVLIEDLKVPPTKLKADSSTNDRTELAAGKKGEAKKDSQHKD